MEKLRTTLLDAKLDDVLENRGGVYGIHLDIKYDGKSMNEREFKVAAREKYGESCFHMGDFVSWESGKKLVNCSAKLSKNTFAEGIVWHAGETIRQAFERGYLECLDKQKQEYQKITMKLDENKKKSIIIARKLERIQGGK